MTKQFRFCFLVISFILLPACSRQEIIFAETPIPTVALATDTPHPTATVEFFFPDPTPLPTTPVIPLITPDASQVQRWNEYEEALAKAFFPSHLLPEDVVCEWVILGYGLQEAYVLAHCAATYAAGSSQGSIPAVVYLADDGTVLNAEIPGAGSSYATGIRRLFPPDVQGKIFDHLVLLSVPQQDHLRWRRGHPETPPLIVLPYLPARPTPTAVAWTTPEPAEVALWKEYQTALAGEFHYLPPEEVICEWEILGRSGNEIYVWVVSGELMGFRVALEGLAVVYVNEDGSVLGAFRSDDPKLYSPDAIEKYHSGSIHFQELVDHLRWRQRDHLDAPPLLVQMATSTP